MVCYDNYLCYGCGSYSEIVHAFCYPLIYDNGEYIENPQLGRRLEFLTKKKYGKIISKYFPNYFKDYSKTAEQSYFMNHCQHCKAKFGDWFIYIEWDVETAYEEIEPIRTVEIDL